MKGLNSGGTFLQNQSDIYVAKPKSGALINYNKITWIETAIQSKTSAWAAVNF